MAANRPEIRFGTNLRTATDSICKIVFAGRQRLTLNLGLRWDYFGVAGEKNNLFYRFNPANGGSVIQVGSNGGPSGLYNPDHNNFAPRVALAYDVTGKGKTVVRAGWGIFYDAFSQDIFVGHAPFNCSYCPGPAYTGVGPAAILATSGVTGTLVPNQPVFPSYSPLGNLFVTNPNIRTPYVQNFNLNIQQQINSKAVIQVGYVGSTGTKLFRFRDINQPSQAAITAGDLTACTGGFTAPNCPIPGFDSGSNAPRPYSNYFYINQEESSASSSYNAFQASLRISGWHGLASQANYVWSHSIDDASDSEDFIPNASQPNNSLAPQLERGNSNFDIRRPFTWNFTYQIPKLMVHRKATGMAGAGQQS